MAVVRLLWQFKFRFPQNHHLEWLIIATISTTTTTTNNNKKKNYYIVVVATVVVAAVVVVFCKFFHMTLIIVCMPRWEIEPALYAV